MLKVAFFFHYTRSLFFLNYSTTHLLRYSNTYFKFLILSIVAVTSLMKSFQT
jgi:hypothetical protein